MRTSKLFGHIAILWVLLAAIAPTALADAEIEALLNDPRWKMIESEHNVRLYQRPANNTDVHEIKAVSVVPYALKSKIKTMLVEPDLFCDWVHDCMSSEQIPTPFGYAFAYRMVLDAPFPYTDRETVNKVQIFEEAGERDCIYFVGQYFDMGLPEKRNPRRLKVSDGTWRLVRLDDDNVEITLYFAVDLGGGVPDWGAERFLKKISARTVSNLMKNAANDND